MAHNPYFGHVSGSGMTPMNMMGMGGMGGMGMGMNPYMQMGMQGHGGPTSPMGMPQSPGMGMSGQSVAPPASSGTSGGGGGVSVKPYDASLLKAGRMGHYGYLQGRGVSYPLLSSWCAVLVMVLMNRIGRTSTWDPSRRCVGERVCSEQVRR